MLVACWSTEIKVGLGGKIHIHNSIPLSLLSSILFSVLAISATQFSSSRCSSLVSNI